MSDNDKAERTSVSEAKGERGSAPAWVVLLGGALMIGGVAVAALPYVAPRHGWITNSVARHGIPSITVALAGLGLCGLWSVARSRRPKLPAPEPIPDSTPQLDQLASNLSAMRGGMQELRVEFVYLKDAVQSIRATLEASNVTENPINDAVYRLAASVDQMNGRIEQRLTVRDETVEDALQDLNRSILSTRAEIEKLTNFTQRIDLGVAEPRHHSEVVPEEAWKSDIEIEAGFRASPNDLQVIVSLEPEVMELGLLDTIDDFGHVRATKTSPSMRPSPSTARSGLDMFEHGSQPAPRGPLPNAAARSESGTDKMHKPGQNGASGEDDVGHKLEQLRDLLSDPRVRQLLDASRMPEMG